MQATDLPLINTVSSPSLAPDGSRVVFSVTAADLETDAYRGQLWTVETTGDAAPRRLTRGFRDTKPAFSPDGSLIAFLRAEKDAPAQLHIVESNGGEPRRITDQKLGVSEFAWSPDSQSLAFISRVPEAGRYGTAEGVGATAEPARRITTLKYRANGVGYTIDRHSQVFRVEISQDEQNAPEPQQLTSDDTDHWSVSFSPDGSALAFVADVPHDRSDDISNDVFVLELGGGALRKASDSGGRWDIFQARFGANGALFFAGQEVGESGHDFVGKNAALYSIEPSSEPRRLTDAETIDLTSGAIVPAADGSVLVQNRSRGSEHLLRVALDGTVTPLTHDPIEVTGVAAAGSLIAFSFVDGSSAGDLALYTHDGIRRLSDFSIGLRETGLAEVRELTVTGRDGYPVHGWVVLPPSSTNSADRSAHPVLLNIHGGPFAQYSAHFFDEAQVYANAGYAVVMCNPRGSAGYGQAHGRSIRQAMGTLDMNDVLDFLDGAIAQFDELDGERVGIMGGSYGGYLTAWTIAHEHRFAAAIVERGFLDPELFAGTSDIGEYFGFEYTGTDLELVRSQSPQAHVAAVRTPTLVIHSEEDYRCPLSQAERYYAALKRGGIETELVVFPGENHELSRSGRPKHRLQRFEIILEWWSRQLPVGGSSSSAA